MLVPFMFSETYTTTATVASTNNCSGSIRVDVLKAYEDPHSLPIVPNIFKDNIPLSPQGIDENKKFYEQPSVTVQGDVAKGVLIPALSFHSRQWTQASFIPVVKWIGYYHTEKTIDILKAIPASPPVPTNAVTPPLKGGISPKRGAKKHSTGTSSNEVKKLLDWNVKQKENEKENIVGGSSINIRTSHGKRLGADALPSSRKKQKAVAEQTLQTSDFIILPAPKIEYTVIDLTKM